MMMIDTGKAEWVLNHLTMKKCGCYQRTWLPSDNLTQQWKMTRETISGWSTYSNWCFSMIKG